MCNVEIWKSNVWVINFNIIIFGIKFVYFFIKDIIIVFLGGYVVIWFIMNNLGLWFFYS